MDTYTHTLIFGPKYQVLQHRKCPRRSITVIFWHRRSKFQPSLKWPKLDLISCKNTDLKGPGYVPLSFPVRVSNWIWKSLVWPVSAKIKSEDTHRLWMLLGAVDLMDVTGWKYHCHSQGKASISQKLVKINIFTASNGKRSKNSNFKVTLRCK